MASGPIKTGVVGLGRSGWNIHALGIAAHPSFELAAVVDPEADRRQEAEERFGCAAYDSFKNLVNDPNVELVIVATPSHTHGPMSCQALEAGKHVLVEKPMATSAAEADRMLECSRASGKILTVYQIQRLSLEFVKIREILASGVLGPLHEIKIGAYSYRRRRDWQTLRKFGGGQMNNNGAHLLDQALILAGGEWRDVFSDLRHVASAGDADDHMKIVFRGRDRVVVDVELTDVAAFGGPHWLILGKYGSITGSPARLEWKIYDPAAVQERTALEGAVAGRTYDVGETIPWQEYTWSREDAPPTDTRAQFYDRLYASIREGAPLFVPPEESRTLTALCDCCRSQNGIEVGGG